MASRFQIYRSLGDSRTLTAGANVTAGRLLALDSNGNVVHAVAGTHKNVIGVAAESRSSGERVRFETGVIEVVLTAGAAISKGASIQLGSDGKVVTASTGIILGVTQEAASADGDLIRCIVNLPAFSA